MTLQDDVTGNPLDALAFQQTVERLFVSRGT